MQEGNREAVNLKHLAQCTATHVHDSSDIIEGIRLSGDSDEVSSSELTSNGEEDLSSPPKSLLNTPPTEWQSGLDRVLSSTTANGAALKRQASQEDEMAPRRREIGAYSTPDVSGPAAEALTASNEVPQQRKYGPQRVPRVRKMFRLGTKKPSRRRKPPKGKVIDGRHELYAITYSMQLGIQRSVEYASTALPDSFEAACKEEIRTKFPPQGSDLTPGHEMKHSFAVKDYAPCVFAKIRQLMGVTPEIYLESLCSGLSYINFIANSRSRQFFFYSYDGVFMIKSLRPDEKNFLLRLLPAYYTHLREHARGDGDAAGDETRFFPQRNSSLLTRFYGLHCTRLKHLRRKVHFVVMSSIFGGADETTSSLEQYDLKGSSHGREAKKDVDIVKKDNDARKNGLQLTVGPERAKVLLESLEADSNFLAVHGVMDYSLLVGIYRPHKVASRPGISSRDQSRAISQSITDPPVPDCQQLSEFNSKHFSRLPSSLALTPPAEELSPRPNARQRPSEDDDHPPLHTSRRPDPFDLAIEGRAPDGSLELYYLGIIDILQVYNLRKRAETTANKVGPQNYIDCSCVSPKVYQSRFLHFLSTIVK